MHKNPKILILGSGQIATACRLIANACVRGCTVQQITRQDLDLNSLRQAYQQSTGAAR